MRSRKGSPPGATDGSKNLLVIARSRNRRAYGIHFRASRNPIRREHYGESQKQAERGLQRSGKAAQKERRREAQRDRQGSRDPAEPARHDDLPPRSRGGRHRGRG